MEFRGELRFLSNFWECGGIFIRLEEGGEIVSCRSVEHAYQALKAVDVLERKWVLASPTAGEAKRRGKRVKIRKDFDVLKLELMEKLVRMKFKNNKELGEKLKKIEGEIEEGNYWGDVFWGVCKGKGENNLGKILMKVRDEL